MREKYRNGRRDHQKTYNLMGVGGKGGSTLSPPQGYPGDSQDLEETETDSKKGKLHDNGIGILLWNKKQASKGRRDHINGESRRYGKEKPVFRVVKR